MKRGAWPLVEQLARLQEREALPQEQAWEQQVLRRLVIGRLTFTPQADGYYAFSGKGTVQPLLGSVVRMLASPTGFEPVSPP